MSGPKRSSYSISRRLYDQRKREQNANRLKQINEITAELKRCTQQIQQIMNDYQQDASHISARVESWMKEVNIAIDSDLRNAWRGLKGIKNYLNKQEVRLKENSQRAKQRQQIQAQRLKIMKQKAEQKEIKKLQQQQKVSEKLENVKNEIANLRIEFCNEISNLLKQPENWLVEAEKELKMNIRVAENNIKGIANYLDNNQSQITTMRENIVKQEKVNRMEETLKSIEIDNPDIMNAGIKQRIDLFIQQIQNNPDNVNTLKQIEQFREQINQKVEEYEIEKQNRKYVTESFANALGGKPEDDGKGGTVVNGEIDGVPITVELNDRNNDFKMDTPTDGSCSRGLEALQKKLADAQISLGDIKVVNTGQTIRNKPIQQKTRNKLKA